MALKHIFHLVCGTSITLSSYKIIGGNYVHKLEDREVEIPINSISFIEHIFE
jgi:hypothetical protein